MEELAFQTGQRRDEVLRDLRRMMKKHMFPQGRLDQKQTTFMLTQDVYQQYLQTEQQNQEAARARQQEEQERQRREREAQAERRRNGRRHVIIMNRPKRS